MIYLRDNNGVFEFSTNGTTWEEVGSGGGVTDHTLLSNIGTNTHAQIDTHIASGAVHVTDHVNLTNIGTNTHAQIDTHIASGAVHVTDHANLTNIGVKSHDQIDDHILNQQIHQQDPVFMESNFSPSIDDLHRIGYLCGGGIEITLPSIEEELDIFDVTIFNMGTTLTITPASTEFLSWGSTVGASGQSVILGERASIRLWGMQGEWIGIFTQGSITLET